jgi:hypothetical protein
MGLVGQIRGMGRCTVAGEGGKYCRRELSYIRALGTVAVEYCSSDAVAAVAVYRTGLG